MLSSVAGIYTILDRETGKLYVGKANAYGGIGKGGIWGRWESYAKTGHGGNKQLIELLENNPERKQDFLFRYYVLYPKQLLMMKYSILKIFIRKSWVHVNTGIMRISNF